MKTYIFYYRTLISDGDILRIEASDIREAIKGLYQFFFDFDLLPHDNIYLSTNYQVYSNDKKLSRRKLKDKHYNYLSAVIKNIVDIDFYGKMPDDNI